MAEVGEHGGVFFGLLMKFQHDSKSLCQSTVCESSVRRARLVHVDRWVERITAGKQPFQLVIPSPSLGGDKIMVSSIVVMVTTTTTATIEREGKV